MLVVTFFGVDRWKASIFVDEISLMESIFCQKFVLSFCALHIYGYWLIGFMVSSGLKR